MVNAHMNLTPADHHAPVPFFRRPGVQTILPMLTSLAIHAGIVVFGYSVYRVARVYTFNTEAAPPITGTWDDGPSVITAKPNPLGVNGDDRLAKIGNSTDLLENESPTFDMKQPKVTSSNLSDQAGDDGQAGMFGIGPGHTIGHSISPGDLGGPAGNVRIGRPGGDANGVGTGISGLPTRITARRVVFVCDATGSMNSVFSGLREELGSAIARLEISQAFNVIFFSDDKVLSLNPTSLLLASAANKTKAVSFMGDVSPRGLTNPLPAIRAAFAQKPELIYVLTDGFDQVDSLESVYTEFATLNKDQKVRVNTILIGSPDQKDLVDLLARIARDNRGTMKVVSKDAF